MRVRLMIIAFSLVVAACGEATSTAPPSGTGTTAPAARTAQPSGLGHLDPALEALLPNETDGTTLVKASAAGADVFQDDAWSREMTAFLTAQGRSASDFQFAQAWDPNERLDLELGVFRVVGVDPAALRDAIVAASRPNAPDLAVDSATVGGKPVTAVVYASGATVYLYEHGDVVYYVGTVNPALAETVLAALP